MANLNKVMLMGRLTSPPEAPRTLPNSGSTVVKFRLAVGRSRKNQQTGQWENDPNQLYIDCEVFSRADAKRNLCDLVTRYVTQGDQLYVEGRLQMDEWEDKNGGGKRSKPKIVVDSVELLGSKAPAGGEDGGSAQNSAPPPKAASKGGKGRGAAAPEAGEGDDGTGIPF